MKTADDKRWDRLQQVLSAGVSGDVPHVSSTRTLFGIRSHVEEVIDRVVEEENARIAAIIEDDRKADGNDKDRG